MSGGKSAYFSRTFVNWIALIHKFYDNSNKGYPKFIPQWIMIPFQMKEYLPQIFTKYILTQDISKISEEYRTAILMIEVKYYFGFLALISNSLR